MSEPTEAMLQWQENVKTALQETPINAQLVRDALGPMMAPVVDQIIGDKETVPLLTVVGLHADQQTIYELASVTGIDPSQAFSHYYSPESHEARSMARGAFFQQVHDPQQGPNPAREFAMQAAAINFSTYAKPAGRNPAQAANAEMENPGRSDFFLTPEGIENHRSLAAAELISAGTNQFVPNYTSSKFLRAVGAFGVPTQRMLQYAGSLAGIAPAPLPLTYENSEQATAAGDEFGVNAALEPIENSQILAQPDGSFQFANKMWNRAQVPPSGEYSIYTPIGTPRFTHYSGYTGTGTVKQTDVNASYPLGFYAQRAAPIANLASHIYIGATDKDGLDTAKSMSSEANIRSMLNRVTPRYPEGMTPEEGEKFRQRMSGVEDKNNAFWSAYAGPILSEATKDRYLTKDGKVVSPDKRTFLSPATQMTFDIIPGAATEPTNLLVSGAMLPMTVAGYGAAGATTALASGKPLVRSLKRGLRVGKTAGKPFRNPFRQTAEEAVEEGYEGYVVGSGMGNQFFTGATSNKLADGLDPNMPLGDYYDALQQKNVDRLEENRNLFSEWNKKTGANKGKGAIKPLNPGTESVSGYPVYYQ